MTGTKYDPVRHNELIRRLRIMQEAYLTSFYKHPHTTIVGVAWLDTSADPDTICSILGMTVVTDTLNLERLEVIG